ncbi:MAG: nucleotidyltransferase substrate binding protein [Armatimonadetes bacterium]|nr:nucleotidyltransferase substrate binding protein [Armatimonadota bacterium]
MLDYTALRKALASLDRAMVRLVQAPSDEEVRDSVVQRFEYTYELCWKMLRRRMMAEAADPGEVGGMSYRELIRKGADRGFVADPTAWMLYRELRNLSSHTYDEAKAEEVSRSMPAFQRDAVALLAALTQEDDGD